MGRGEIDLDNPGDVQPAARHGQLSLQEMQQQAKASKLSGPREPMSQATLDAMRRVAEYNKQRAQGAQGTPAPPRPNSAPPEEKEDAPSPESEAPDVASPDLQDPPLPPNPEMPEGEPGTLNLTGSPYEDSGRKKKIEGRLSDMSFDSLVQHGELRQLVPIRPGVLEVEFRSYSAGEEMFLRGEIYDTGKKKGVNARSLNNASMSHVESMISLYNVALSVTSINSKKLPEHLLENGEVDRDKFYEKVRFIEAMPAVIVGDIVTNWRWFQERLQKLVTVENLKNG